MAPTSSAQSTDFVALGERGEINPWSEGPGEYTIRLQLDTVQCLTPPSIQFTINVNGSMPRGIGLPQVAQVQPIELENRDSQEVFVVLQSNWIVEDQVSLEGAKVHPGGSWELSTNLLVEAEYALGGTDSCLEVPPLRGVSSAFVQRLEFQLYPGCFDSETMLVTKVAEEDACESPRLQWKNPESGAPVKDTPSAGMVLAISALAALVLTYRKYQS